MIGELLVGFLIGRASKPTRGMVINTGLDTSGNCEICGNYSPHLWLIGFHKNYCHNCLMYYKPYVNSKNEITHSI